mmetsp:Transcript_19990/g.36150  ORF Transcript_19990/g.36150 Transcript_19990/m.36150 type:complete len:287 (-) Transcript_19990:265-1125(-)
MNLKFLLTLLFTAASMCPETFTCVASSESEVANKTGDDEDDEFYDLIDMSDEELEEMCISRGFELVREVDGNTGELVLYTHQDYVDAANECLQIEEDLEEILQTNPEIMEDVKRESERMMNERNSLLVQLNQQQEGVDGQTEQQENNTVDVEERDSEVLTNPNASLSDTNDTEDQSNNTLYYGFKEITLEVIEQMKSDFTKVVNLIVPKKLQEQIQLQMKQQIQPALKSFVSVAKGMGMAAYDLSRRYLMAFVNRKAGGDQDVSSDEKMSNEKNSSTQKGEQTTAA